MTTQYLNNTSPISYIIPAYNCSKTIGESIESIIDGNLIAGDEIIIVDDSSTDGTEAIISGLQNKHSTIKLIVNKYNRGGGAARNTAIENAQHSLIFCLDSDNVLVPGSVPFLKEFLISTGAEAACFGEIHFFRDNISNVSHKWIFNDLKYDLADHLAGHVVPGASGNYLYTIESWKRAGGYPEFSGALDAWGFGLRQHATNTEIYVLEKTYYSHRIGIESYWVRDSKKGDMSKKLFQLLIPYLELFKSEDVEYLICEILKEKGIIDLEKNPIHLKSGIVGQVGISDEIVFPKVSFQSRALRWIKKLQHIIGYL